MVKIVIKIMKKSHFYKYLNNQLMNKVFLRFYFILWYQYVFNDNNSDFDLLKYET